MIILGLTGGIGAGKSYIANEFLKKGIPVYDSDERAKELMLTNKNIKTALKNKFGSNVYLNNQLNRKLIADQIFINKDLINWINNLVHPVVADDFNSWATLQKADFVIKEAAILIESGAYKQCDKILVITAPEQLRIKRVIERDKMTPEEVESRIHNQLTDKQRIKYADFVINNDGIVVVNKEVEKIIHHIKEIR